MGAKLKIRSLAFPQGIAVSKVTIVVLLLVSQVFSCFVLAATAGDDQTGAADHIIVRLAATRYNTGKIGMAILTPAGDKTAMTIQVSGVSEHDSRPTYLYADLFEGSCARRNPTPMYVQTKPGLAQWLTDPTAIGAFCGPAQFSQILPVSFRKLRTTPFAIVVHLGPEDGNTEIFCGDSAN